MPSGIFNHSRLVWEREILMFSYSEFQASQLKLKKHARPLSRSSRLTPGIAQGVLKAPNVANPRC